MTKLILAALIGVSVLLVAFTDLIWDRLGAVWFLWAAFGWLALFGFAITLFSALQGLSNNKGMRESVQSLLGKSATPVILMVLVVGSAAAARGVWKILDHGLFVNLPPTVDEPSADPNPVAFDETSSIRVKWKDDERDPIAFTLMAESGTVPDGHLKNKKQTYTPTRGGEDTITIKVFDTHNAPVTKYLIIMVTTDETKAIWNQAIKLLGSGEEPPDYPMAQDLFGTVTDVASGFDQAWMAKGLADAGALKWDLAEDAFDEFIAVRENANIQPGALPYLWRTYAQVNLGNLPGASTSLMLATDEDPDLADFRSQFETAQTDDERLDLLATAILESPNPFLPTLEGTNFPSDLLANVRQSSD